MKLKGWRKKEIDRLLNFCSKLTTMIKKHEETCSTSGSMRGGKAPRQGPKREQQYKSPNMNDSVQSYNTNPDFWVNDDEKSFKRGSLRGSIIKKRAKEGNTKTEGNWMKWIIF